MGRKPKKDFKNVIFFNNNEIFCFPIIKKSNSKNRKPKLQKGEKPEQVSKELTINTYTNDVCPQANVIGGTTNFETSEQLEIEEQFLFPDFESQFDDDDNDFFFPF